MRLTVEGLLLRRRIYWVSLEDQVRSDNKESVTVDISGNNVFGVETLREMLAESRRRVSQNVR